MKKLILAFTLMIAFSISTNAQTKKPVTAQEKGRTEASELTKYLGLNEEQNSSVTAVLVQKHQTLEIASLSEERKTVLYQYVDAQLKSYLNADQIKKFESNKELQNRITH